MGSRAMTRVVGKYPDWTLDIAATDVMQSFACFAKHGATVSLTVFLAVAGIDVSERRLLKIKEVCIESNKKNEDG